jgi:hypothetical protein
MAVVRGDRIGESTALNKVSREAQTFYSAFVAAVPDDFGRFRVAPSHIWTAMYPRREPKPNDLRWVMRMVLELQKADAFLTYAVDGQDFAQVAKWRPTGNMVHRCPEPPIESRFVPHEHTGRCLSTAISRAKEWGTPEEVAILINRLKEIKGRKPDGRPTEQGAGARTPVNPSTRIPVQEEQTVSESAAVVEIRAARETCQRELDLLVSATGRPADQALAFYSSPGRGTAAIVNIQACQSASWLRTTADRLRGARLKHEGEMAEQQAARARASPPGKPTAAAVTVGAVQQIMREEAEKREHQSRRLLGGPGGDSPEAEPASNG